MREWLLSLELVTSPVGAILATFATLLVVMAVVPRPRRFRRFLIGAAGGAALGGALYVLLNATNVFGVQLPLKAALWSSLAMAGAGAAVAAVTVRPWWRRLVAVLAIVVSILAGAVGVNQAFGLQHNLAALLGIQAAPIGPLPPLTYAADPEGPLYQSWTPPADMPTQGSVLALSGDTAIPSPGFAARDAAVYLPPAALVPNPPRLPLLVFMMGQPGSPDPSVLAKALEAYAAQHNGLAPIAIIADQLGTPMVDPVCQNSTAFGAVADYFTEQIPQFARTHLNVMADSSRWIIGGYSNGGSCAWLWAAQHPDIWGNLLDVSGNEYPGSDNVDAAVREVFGGDRAAFDAASPAQQLALHPGAYDGHVAVFSSGENDGTYGPGQKRNAALAQAAGFTVTSVIIPGADHFGAAVDQGLLDGLGVLGSALGLAAPSS